VEQIVLDIASQVPALAVLAFIVVIFLRFLRAEGDVARSFIQSQNEQLRLVVVDNTTVMREYAKHMLQLAEVVRGCRATGDPVGASQSQGVKR